MGGQETRVVQAWKVPEPEASAPSAPPAEAYEPPKNPLGWDYNTGAAANQSSGNGHAASGSYAPPPRASAHHSSGHRHSNQRSEPSAYRLRAEAIRRAAQGWTSSDQQDSARY